MSAWEKNTEEQITELKEQIKQIWRTFEITDQMRSALFVGNEKRFEEINELEQKVDTNVLILEVMKSQITELEEKFENITHLKVETVYSKELIEKVDDYMEEQAKSLEGLYHTVSDLKKVLQDIGGQARNSANFGNSYEFFDKDFWRDILEKLTSEIRIVSEEELEQREASIIFPKEKLPEYSMTQKGLDAVDKIIKDSPQYKALLEEIDRLKKIELEYRKRQMRDI